MLFLSPNHFRELTYFKTYKKLLKTTKVKRIAQRSVIGCNVSHFTLHGILFMLVFNICKYTQRC